jgi:hypothetical protein
MFTQLYQRQDTARAPATNHARLVGRLLISNHAHAVRRALAINHSRAVVAAGPG